MAEKLDKVLAPAMPVPAFGDISKAANDLIALEEGERLTRPQTAELNVKLRTPSDVAINVKGKQDMNDVTSGNLEAKYTDKPRGTQAVSSSDPPPQQNRFLRSLVLQHPILKLPPPLRTQLYFFALLSPEQPLSWQRFGLTLRHPPAGTTLTQNFTTGSLLDTKAEIVDALAPGTKLELQNIASASGAAPMSQKINFAFKNPNVHTRAFITHSMKDNNINAVIDAVAAHEGFVVGGEAGYNLQKAAITGYSLAVGYQTPKYTAAITGTQNLSIIAATLYQKVNSSVEVGIKTGFDVQASKASGLEIASKYKLDPLSFAKGKVNDRGIAALAYSTKLNAGTTLGIGMSLDTAKLNEAGHKIGTSLTFEG
ncbi:Mitochondrial porin [Saxophila tyrrhenica]|uniref:Mitochondrial porin n=1 Tax=Saxophila tyrrhenica TaxID=1690608 RepID=A0AAV9PDI7_9PEZI|nr:Mitochondrial porin [Saxophila tyrrhenica]